MNGAYRYRYAPFLVPIYDALALPLGELSPQVTERALRPRDVICLRRCQHFPIDVFPSHYPQGEAGLETVLRPSDLGGTRRSSLERWPPLPQGEARCRGTETVLRPSDFRPSAARALRGSRKQNGAYRYRYAPFLVPIYDALALPLGELSPQVTERALRPRDVICLRRCQHFPIDVAVICPSPSSLLATSPTGRGKVPGRKPFYDHPTFGRHAH